MTRTAADKRAAFRALHESGCFTMPNPWDVGSAMALETLGFKALASTSSGMAWSMGRPDGAVALDEVLIHLSRLAHATSLPLNADFENAFADTPEGVAANVALAVDTGVAGLSVEDWPGAGAEGLYDAPLAAERVQAAREAIDRAGSGVVLTARCEGLLHGGMSLPAVIARLQAYAAAGADCLFAPGLREETQIQAVVEALAPRAVNVLSVGLPVAVLAGLGVRRISVGGGLASVAWGHFLGAARELAAEGTLGGFAGRAPGLELNALFAAAGKGV